MKGKSVYKAAKLVKINVEYEDNRILSIDITGDFFIYPEDRIKEIALRTPSPNIH